MFFEAVEELGLIDRLGKEAQAANVSGMVVDLGLPDRGGQEDDRNIAELGMLAEEEGEVAAIEPGHHDVQQDEVRSEIERGCHSQFRVVLDVNEVAFGRFEVDLQ